MSEPKSDVEHYMLRLPPGLRDRIKSQSEARGTSINSLIVGALEEEFPEPTLESLMSEIMSHLKPKMNLDDLTHVVDTLKKVVQGVESGKLCNLTEEQRLRVAEKRKLLFPTTTGPEPSSP